MKSNVVDWLSEAPFAHRGLHSSGIPENSMPAFEAAAGAGYGIELDIHGTVDGHLIVFHDDSTLRMTGQDFHVTQVESGVLSGLRLDGTQYQIPLFEDVIARIAGRVPILIEIKPGTPMDQAGPPLLRILDGYVGPTAIQSFDPRIIRWVKEYAPHVIRGQLSGSFSRGELSLPKKWLLRSMAWNAVTRPQFIAFDVDSMPSIGVQLWRSLLRIPLLLWTVRTEEQAKKAERYGANLIFEDLRPALRAEHT